MMTITEMKNKVKILLEYPTRIGLSFLALYSGGELDKLIIKVHLKNGDEVVNKDIDYISLKIRKDEEVVSDDEENN